MKNARAVFKFAGWVLCVFVFVLVIVHDVGVAAVIVVLAVVIVRCSTNFHI